jgi:uncharacterized protein
MNQDQRDEIVRLTEEYGGKWGINHTQRLLRLIEIIGEGQQYDAEVIWIAAHLHDWGGYAPWIQPGVDHALRSKQVAQEYLNQKEIPQATVEAILECIELHHRGGLDRRIESILLADADALDFLGVVGVLRDFAKQPKDLRKGYESSCQRLEQLRKVICLEKTKEIAALRIQKMESMLATFAEETFGFF